MLQLERAAGHAIRVARPPAPRLRGNRPAAGPPPRSKIRPMPDPSPQAHLILASASPRRQALLRDAGYAFVVDPADIDEDDVPPGLLPPDLAEHLAIEKARVVAARHPAGVVLAAD